MVSIKFYNSKTVKEKFPEYDADSLAVISGDKEDVSKLMSYLEASYIDFFGSQGTVKFMIKDFKEFVVMFRKIYKFYKKDKKELEVRFS